MEQQPTKQRVRRNSAPEVRSFSSSSSNSPSMKSQKTVSNFTKLLLDAITTVNTNTNTTSTSNTATTAASAHIYADTTTTTTTLLLHLLL